MRIQRVALQSFRNIKALRLDLPGNRLFLTGKNGQGKSNLLEALGYITALRSFRVNETSALIEEGQKEAVILVELEHEHMGGVPFEVRLRRGGKQVVLDGERVSALSSIIGQFPTVVLSAEDLELLRGNPGRRREFLDLLCSSVDAEYLRQLKAYNLGLKSRNLLLKGEAGAGLRAQARAFEQQMAHPAAFLVQRRRSVLHTLFQGVEPIYKQISQVEERPVVDYRPNLAPDTADGFLAAWKEGFERDVVMGSTRIGPQRDDFMIQILGRRAKVHASEGQKRGLVTAIKLAECRMIQDQTGLQPVLLADDIVGELDPNRRRGLWESMDQDWQVIATGTDLPDDRFKSWQVIEVADGQFTAKGGKERAL